MKDPSDVGTEGSDPSRQAADRRRLKILWGGLILYFLILLNSIRYLERVPYQAFIAAGFLNLAIMTSIGLAIRRTYRRLRR